jgi:ADP-heptose:LPS heptosyltransferase
MQPRHILVIRNSAMGDVAMTVPVLHQLLQQYPQVHITILTQPFLAPLFESLERTTVFPMEIKGRHKGIGGILRAVKEIKKTQSFDAVADLHNVLRSKLISFLFRLAGVKVATINKGRKEKKELTAKENKKLVQLKTSFQRYADVFAALQLPLAINNQPAIFFKQPLPLTANTLLIDGKKYIGIAPFAKHKEKMYPLDKMKAVATALASQKDVQLFLLGGGAKEMEELQEWEKSIPNCTNLAGKFSFNEELAIISQLTILISMDSANMHLASLFAVPVVSVWGATHPFAGFYGWGQAADNAAQIELSCRPCSVFGNKPCYRGDHACMHLLREDSITEKVREIL